jgi:hypothetical protein
LPGATNRIDLPLSLARAKYNRYFKRYDQTCPEAC